MDGRPSGLVQWCNKDICSLHGLAMDRRKWSHFVKYVMDTNGHWAHGTRERERHNTFFGTITNLDGRRDTAHFRRMPANSDTIQQRTNWLSWYPDSGWSSYESSRSVKCASPTWWHGNCSCNPRVFTTPITNAGITVPGCKSDSRSNSQQQQIYLTQTKLDYTKLQFPNVKTTAHNTLHLMISSSKWLNVCRVER